MVLLIAVATHAADAPVEVLTLSDGRTFTGVYDEDALTITLSGRMKAVIRVEPGQVIKREPAPDAEPVSSSAASPDLALRSGGLDETAFDALVADTVPWAPGDRILVVGDLLVQPGQREFSLRMHDIVTAKRPELGLSVFALHNHGIPLEQWVGAAKQEIHRQPPKVVIVMAGVGDVLHAMPPPPAAGAAPAAPTSLTLPSAEQWREQLTDLVSTAKQAGAAVVVATPAIVGDKPAGGPGASELDAYAVAARAVAAEHDAVLCDLRMHLLARLRERNPKSTRETGILSRAPGHLRPEGIDICARLLAEAVAAAVPKIPGSIAIPDTVFSDHATVAIRTARLAPDQVDLHYTTDGSEPGVGTPRYTQPIVVDTSTHLRAVAISKDRRSRQHAEGWQLKAVTAAAERAGELVGPGLWVEHFPVADWTTPIPQVRADEANLATWWPNAELDVFAHLPPAERPTALGCLRYSGILVVPSDGTYCFALRGRGESRLFIGEQAVVLRSEQHHEQRGAITLGQGHHRLSIYHRASPDHGSLSVFAAESGQRLQPLPDLLLHRPPRTMATPALSEPAHAAMTAESTWSIHLPAAAFEANTRVEPILSGIAADAVDLYVTTDGSEPSTQSERLVGSLPIGSTTRVRILAVARQDGSTATTEAWFTEYRSHSADGLPSESLPGLWVDHIHLESWTNPIAAIDKKRANFTTWWPNVELRAISTVPVHLWPNHLFGLRFSGYFFAPVDGIYTFAVSSDDAARITMGIVPVLRNDDLHPERLQVESVALTAGFHTIEIPYGQGPGVTALSVRVGLAGQRLRDLPDLVLRRAAQAPASAGGGIGSP